MQLVLGESEGARVSDDFVYISKMVVGYYRLAGWTSFTMVAEIVPTSFNDLPRRMRYDTCLG